MLWSSPPLPLLPTTTSCSLCGSKTKPDCRLRQPHRGKQEWISLQAEAHLRSHRSNGEKYLQSSIEETLVPPSRPVKPPTSNVWKKALLIFKLYSSLSHGHTSGFTGDGSRQTSLELLIINVWDFEKEAVTTGYFQPPAGDRSVCTKNAGSRCAD